MTVPPKPTPFSRALDDLARGVASQRKKLVELYHAKMKEPRTSSSK